MISFVLIWTGDAHTRLSMDRNVASWPWHMMRIQWLYDEDIITIGILFVTTTIIVSGSADKLIRINIQDYTDGLDLSVFVLEYGRRAAQRAYFRLGEYTFDFPCTTFVVCILLIDLG